ncbi:MAG TPA: hypothetical protein VF054_01050 [Micromonosporaceae bacterium]
MGAGVDEFATVGTAALAPERGPSDSAALAPERGAGGTAARVPGRSRADGATARPAGGNTRRARAVPLRVAPPAPVARPRAPFVTLVLGVVVVGVLGILVLNTKINENAFKLQHLEEQQTTLNSTEQQLAQQIADQSAPGNLAAVAAMHGLVPAGTPAFIRLPDGRVLGVPQPATGQPSVTSQSGRAAGGQTGR